MERCVCAMIELTAQDAIISVYAL